MHAMIKHKSIIALLMALLFAAQSISPLYASARCITACERAAVDHDRDGHSIFFGILWLHIALDENVPALTPAALDSWLAHAHAQSENDNDFIIVKRKRIVLRSRVSVKPYLFAPYAFEQTPDPAFPPTLSHFIHAVIVSESNDGRYLRKTGLSPPFLSA